MDEHATREALRPDTPQPFQTDAFVETVEKNNIYGPIKAKMKAEFEQILNFKE